MTSDQPAAAISTPAFDPELRVAGLGLAIEQLDAGQQPLALLETSDSSSAVADLVASLEDLLGHARRLIVIGPDWVSDQRWRQLLTARTLLDGDRVALWRSDLPPLAASVAAALAAGLGPALGPGGLMAAMSRLERELVILAWLARVSGLRRPAPSVSQHARSIVPGAGFLATLAPEESVVGLQSDEPALDPLPADHELIIAAQDGADRTWIDGPGIKALGSPPVRSVEPTQRAAKWWGTPKVIEAVGRPRDWSALVTRLQPADLERCEWCGTTVGPGPCPFCGTDARGQQGGSR